MPIFEARGAGIVNDADPSTRFDHLEPLMGLREDRRDFVSQPIGMESLPLLPESPCGEAV